MKSRPATRTPAALAEVPLQASAPIRAWLDLRRWGGVSQNGPMRARAPVARPTAPEPEPDDSPRRAAGFLRSTRKSPRSAAKSANRFEKKTTQAIPPMYYRPDPESGAGSAQAGSRSAQRAQCEQ